MKTRSRWTVIGEYAALNINGIVFKIDAGDVALASKYKWLAPKGSNGKPYARAYSCIVRENGKRTQKNIYLHRLVMMGHDSINLKRSDGVIDHINGDTTDNRTSNLRICSHGSNLSNRDTPNRNKADGLPRWVRKTTSGKYIAGFSIDGVFHYTKTVATPEEAHSLALEKHRELGSVVFSASHQAESNRDNNQPSNHN